MGTCNVFLRLNVDTGNRGRLFLGAVLRRYGATLVQVKALTAAEDVKGAVDDRQHVAGFDVEVVGRGIASVDERDHSGPEGLECTLAVNQRSGVFVQPDADEARIGGEGREQATHPTTLAEVLVDDD